MKALTGPDFLVLNHDVDKRVFNPDKVKLALHGLREVASQLGLPGTYLGDSLTRYLDQPQNYSSLDQAFGLVLAGGGRRYLRNERDADAAYECLEMRLSGLLAKQVELPGFSRRRLTDLQAIYYFDSVTRARTKRGEGGFSVFEKKVLTRMQSRSTRSIAKLYESEDSYRVVVHTNGPTGGYS